MYTEFYPEPVSAYQHFSAVTLTYVLSCYILASHHRFNLPYTLFNLIFTSNTFMHKRHFSWLLLRVR